MFRGARTFIAATVEALRNELNRFAGDVHAAFRDIERDVAELQTDTDALQVLAAQQSSNAATLGPGDPLTYTADPVTPQKTGTYLASATMSGTITGGTDTIQVQLAADGTVAATVDVPATGDGWGGSVSAVVTLDTTVPHTWSVSAATFGGLLNITTPAARAVIVLVEF